MWLWLGLEKNQTKIDSFSCKLQFLLLNVYRQNKNTQHRTHVYRVGQNKHNVMSLFMNETIPLPMRTKRNYLCLVMKIDMVPTKCAAKFIKAMAANCVKELIQKFDKLVR